jgi:hypothetical protein
MRSGVAMGPISFLTHCTSLRKGSLGSTPEAQIEKG